MILRIPKSVFNQMHEDLRAAHPVAAERIGFLKCRRGTVGDRVGILLGYDYYRVPDNLYIPDRGVGARIGSEAIHQIMQEALSIQDSIFHVHLHEWSGKPQLSRTDTQSIIPLVQSLHNVSAGPHGVLLLSADNLVAWVMEAGNLVAIERVRIINQPVQMYG